MSPERSEQNKTPITCIGVAIESGKEPPTLAEQIAALDETAGVWTDTNHPDMRTEEDIDRWITKLRSSWGQSGAADHDNESLPESEYA